MVIISAVRGLKSSDPGINIRTGNLPADKLPVGLGAGILLGGGQMSEKLIRGGLRNDRPIQQGLINGGQARQIRP